MQTGAGKLQEAAGHFRRSGDLPAARDLLLQAQAWHEPAIVTLAVLILNDLEDSEALQHVLGQAIAALPDLAHTSDEYLIFLHRRTEQYCIGEDRRALLLQMMTARAHEPERAADCDLSRVLAAGQERRNFGAAFRAKFRGVSFVPLGLNCMPWVLVNRWGLHDPQTYRRNLSPFAMAVHTIPGVAAAMEDGFASYAAVDQVMTITAPGGRPVVMRKDRGATWVHHDNKYFFTDDYANLRAAMAQRAASLSAACQAEHPVLMMNFVNSRYPDQKLHFLPRLRRAIAAFTGRDDLRLFMSNTIHATEGEHVYKIDDRTCFFYCTAPEKGFKWNQDANLDSATSMAFERTYLTRIESCLDLWRTP